MEEVWVDIEGYSNYLVSNYGTIYNRRTEKFMSLSKTMQGDLKVTLVSKSGDRVTRSVRVLVAEAFVPKPFEIGDERNDYCDTVIVLNHNKNHVSANNLAWRPKWFAHRYARQVVEPVPNEYYRDVKNIHTNVVYSSIMEACDTEGLLYKDVFNSTIFGDSVYPFFNSYIFT